LGVKSDNITEADQTSLNLEVDLQNVAAESETKLVQAAIGGDIKSFGRLCERYYPAMVAIGYSVLTDHQLAEDAAQESFARALVRLRTLKNSAKFAPWLAAICRNAAKDMVTLRARRVFYEGVSDKAKNNNPDNSSQAIHQAIEQLPDSAKELIVLRYYNNLSYEQISSVLGISKATINGRLTRAKRKLAGYLKRSGFPENQL
jgi:RNA polymerase sigma-70 factor (ECF subfamily)